MAIREFKLIGITYTPDVEATIVINGTEVLAGTLTEQTEIENPIAAGSIDINDSVEIIVPVTITVTSGVASIGMFKWNCAGTMPNPVYTPEQIAVLRNPATTQAERVAIAQTVAVPPFTSEEIALLETSTDANEVNAILKDHNATLNVADPAVFDYGDTDELCTDNRNLVQVDGSPITVNDNEYIWVPEGSVLTFDQIIFARP